MEAKIVDLQEWVSFGGGGFGESYYNKTDDSVILKLNKPGISASKAEEARRRRSFYAPRQSFKWGFHRPNLMSL